MNPTHSEPKGKPPIQRLKIWPVQCSIWENQSEGGPFLTATFDRVYKDAGDQYKNGQSYSIDDLLKLAKLADLAHTWILRKQAEDRQSHQSITVTANAGQTGE